MTAAGRGPRRALPLAAFATAVAVQLAVLYWPRAVGEAAVPGADKVVHALVFAAVAWTGLRAGLPVRWLVGALVLHAPLSELLQHLVLPGRSGDPRDVLADWAGVAAGVLGARIGGSWRHDRARGDRRADRPTARRDAGAG